MGKVLRPEDLRSRKRYFEKALSDLAPGLRDEVLRLVDEWRGEEDFEKLSRLIGSDRAKKLMKDLGLF